MTRVDHYEEQYVNIVEKLLLTGEQRKVRNGETYAMFGAHLDIDVNKSFPLLRGRQMFYKPVLGELAAMFRGPTNIEDFKKFGCNYWDEWGDMEGYLKLDYGNSWIDFNGVNQLEELVNSIRLDPTGRRHIVTGWRPDRLKELSLPCCHMLYQFYVRDGKYLDMIWYQRSADWMVGVPADVILGTAWLAILAAETAYEPGRLKMVFGDTHIYGNHVEGAIKYLRQWSEVRDVGSGILPYTVSGGTTMQTFKPEDIVIQNYLPGYYKPAIKFQLNV